MNTNSQEFERYLGDSSGYRGEAEQVFLPADVSELREVVRSSAPLTVVGAGTGLTGASVPHGGGIVSLERFRKIEIERGRARCGTGATLRDLQKAAARTKQFFGPNPTEDSASIGGIINTNAGGARSFHYGSVRRHVLALEVTFPNGRTERFERGQKVDFPVGSIHQPATTKNSAGYYLRPDLEWVDLLAGSEGTLGIITEAELQLLPEPGGMLSGVVFFPAEDLALAAVKAWRPVQELRLLEFLDYPALELLRPRYAEIPPQARGALLVEQNLTSEDDPEVDAWTERLAEQGALGEESWFGLREADRERFREFRHTLPVMVVDTVRRNGFPKTGTDYAVPLAHERELHDFYKRRCEDVAPGQYTIYGHAGDANNHVNLFPVTKEQAARVEAMMYEFAQFVVSLGGTVAAEHGIGKGKTDLLALMYTAAEIGVMKEVKKHLDPEWRLWRGTIFPV
ncbi:MAG: FAD-binding oxidoreductase [Bryobacteraceae bacterium]